MKNDKKILEFADSSILLYVLFKHLQDVFYRFYNIKFNENFK